MWTPDYDITVETLTGSEFELTVRETDTVGYLKFRIKKYEGIPVPQQHILFNQKELSDSTFLKDVPLVRGSKVTLVLGLRGGPISARRVVADCDNWYDLSDVLNGTNRGQLTPIEPLTISTTGVKVLLYKDCKKNINRLMKLRKHQLHSHGANGVSGAAATASLSGNPFKCTPPTSASAVVSASNNNNSSSGSSRTQSRGRDRGGIVSNCDDRGKAATQTNVSEANEQWLMDNLATLKKMKQLRQSLDAKKKKKPRSGDVSEAFSQELKNVQNDLEMHDKLQRWLHRVASNATHLTDAELLPATASSSHHHHHNHHPCNNNNKPSSSSVGLFDRMRRKTSNPNAAMMTDFPMQQYHNNNNTTNNNSISGGSVFGADTRPKSSSSTFLNPFSAAVSGSGGYGGARKKDNYSSFSLRGGSSSSASSSGTTTMQSSATYSTPDEYFLGCSSSTNNLPNKLGGEEEVEEDGDFDEDFDEDGFPHLSIEEIDRRLMAANDMEPPPPPEECPKREEIPNRPQPQLSHSGPFEDRLLTQFYDNTSPQCENLFRAFSVQTGSGRGSDGGLSGGGGTSEDGPTMTETEFMSKFQTRFRRERIEEAMERAKKREPQEENPQKKLADDAREAFFTSLLDDPPYSESQKASLGASVESASANEKRRFRKDIKWSDSTQQQRATDFVNLMMEKKGSNRTEGEVGEDDENDDGDSLPELSTVIIERADEECGEDSLLEAACDEIFNDPEAFEDEDEQLAHVESVRYELADLLGSSEAEQKRRLGAENEEENDNESNEIEEEILFLKDSNSSSWPNCEFDHNTTTANEEDTEEEEREFVEELQQHLEGAVGGVVPIPVSVNGEPLENHNHHQIVMNSSEADALEYDDFVYYPGAFKKQSLPTIRPSVAPKETQFLPRIDSAEPQNNQHHMQEREIRKRPTDGMANFRVHNNSSLPTIGNDQRNRRRSNDNSDLQNYSSSSALPSEHVIKFDTLENVAPGGVKREREDHRQNHHNYNHHYHNYNNNSYNYNHNQSSHRNRVPFPDINLLEADLKMMGLDSILNDSDSESFERTIKRHFRADRERDTVKCSSSATVSSTRDRSDWLMQLDREAAKGAVLEVDKSGPGEVKVEENNKEEEKKKKSSGNRCAKCNKKLGIIMIMKCHCGLLFCSQHRYAEAHDCTYDFKEEGKRILAKENLLVVADKVRKV